MNLNMRHGITLKLFVIFALFASTLFLGGAFAGSLGQWDKAAFAANLEGGVGAPDFELKNINGDTVKLSAFKGHKPTLLYFWATWCPYCVAAREKISKIRENISADKLEIIGIDVGEGDSLQKVKKFLESHPENWQVLYDEGGVVSRKYAVQGIPLFILLNKDGKVVYRDNSVPTDPLQYLKD